MKQILSYLIAGTLALLLGACNLMQDRAYDQTPDERLKKTMAEYAEAIVSAPSGWIFTINTGNSGGYQLYMSFNDSDRVIMLCDMDATFDVGTATSSIPNESSYQLKALQMPSLIFDTYNYLHLMADPQGSINGGTTGVGLKSDFEFDILKFDSGEFTLRGTYNKCMAYMRRATPEEAEAALRGELKGVFDRLKEYRAEVKYPVIELDGKKYALELTGRTAAMKWTDEKNAAQTASSGACMELTGLQSEPAAFRLFTPLEVGGKTITGFVWNGEAYDAVDEAGSVYEGYDNLVPVLPLQLGADQEYTTITFTTPTEFAGTVSQAYLDTYYTPAEELYTAWKRKISTIKCLFTTDTDGKPVFRVYAYSQTPPATTIYQAAWDIQYTINEDGTYTFGNREAGGDSGNITNARNYGQKMRGMLDIFSKVVYKTYTYTNSTTFEIEVESVEPHTFRLDWMPSKTPGIAGPLGAFIQVDNPDMYFCGTLSK